MGSNWEAIGFFRWPMALCFFLVVVIGLWSALTAMAPGIKMTLLSVFFGTIVLVFAVLVWYVLQLRWRFMQAAEAST